MLAKLLSAAIFSRPPTSIRGKIMNLLGTIFRSGSIHIWSSNGCFQRRDGVLGSSHTLTVTLADVLLIDSGPRWRCKSTQAGCISNCGSKRNDNNNNKNNHWGLINGCRRGQIAMEDAKGEGVGLPSRWRRLGESCHWLISRARAVMWCEALPWQVKNKHGGHRNVKHSLVRH